MSDIPLWSTPADCSARPSGKAVDWLPEVWDILVGKLLDPADDYPCHFGTQGEQRGHNSYTVVDPRHPGEYGVDQLGRTLLEFRERAWSGVKRQTLIAFIGPPEPEADLAAHGARLWDLLNELSALDRAPWPADVPKDTSDPRWQWCFGGEPWFIFAGSPGYRQRRSRNFGPCLTVIFQTRRVFEGLGGSTVAGKAGKKRIRERLLDYDEVPPHPYLGDPLLSSAHKWRQYVLPDDQSVDSSPCPFAH
ncbi:YqcI/YcgG family protein [Kitasatospora sp. NPDC058162]|uniref:YqcI/YcgG family protein n=1 Tax=Kitasatospora sp. NPDC058162 TaxID=3346362 RepID=UPI0036DAA808